MCGLGNKGCNPCSKEKNPTAWEEKKKRKEKKKRNVGKSPNPDVPHQQMPFVFDDVLNYILG